MAPLKIPPELKKITPFIKRAEELDRNRANPESRVMAYYCRQYAVQAGIPLANSSAAGKKCLGDLLNELEKEKQAMSVFSKEEAELICRRFADKVFDKADAEDRMGNANKDTAKTFYAAATFYEVMQQFYAGEEKTEEQEEEAGKVKYSKWKATEILKAIKEGRQPTPGGYGENEEDEAKEAEEEQRAAAGEVKPQPALDEIKEEENAPSDDEGDEEGTEVGLGPPPAYPAIPETVEEEDDEVEEVFVPSKASEPPKDFNRPPMTPPVAPVVPPPAPAAEKKSSSGGLFGFGSNKPSSNSGKVSKQALADAIELTKFALKALKSKDAELGATRLQEALAALGR